MTAQAKRRAKVELNLWNSWVPERNIAMPGVVRKIQLDVGESEEGKIEFTFTFVSIWWFDGEELIKLKLVKKS